MRILHSDSEAQCKGNSRNHVLQHPQVSVVIWAPKFTAWKPQKNVFKLLMPALFLHIRILLFWVHIRGPSFFGNSQILLHLPHYLPKASYLPQYLSPWDPPA